MMKKRMRSRPLSGREVIAALKRLGYSEKRRRGSHVRLYHAERKKVTVPLHKELRPGTLAEIMRTVGLSREELEKLL